jgi:hypothetical protein
MLYRLIPLLTFCLTMTLAQAQLPARDLVIELRQIEEVASGYSAGAQQHDSRWTPRMLQVRNGAKAVFSLGQSVPVQWVRSVAAQSASLSASGVQASSRGGGVSQALTWMDSGQKITVLPRWPGGRQSATVEVEVQGAAIAQRNGTELPAQTRSLLVTTVSAPPGQWVTLASLGGGAPAGTYSSESTHTVRSLLQLRLSAP